MNKEEEIIDLAKEIIEATENRKISVESLVFKACRLAKITNNEKILEWLVLEKYGYCDKEPDITYMKSTGRTFDEKTRIGQWGPISRQELEIEKSLMEIEIIKGFKPSGQYANVQFGAQQQRVQNLANTISFYKGICSKVTAYIQDFAVNVYSTYKFKQKSLSIIDKKQTESTNKIVEKFPTIKDFFEIINNNMESNNAKDWSAVALQCRNILIFLSDELWKKTGKYKCKDGDSIETNTEKNKLIAYIDTKIGGSKTERAKAVRLFKTIHEIFTIAGKAKRGIGKEELSTIVTQTFIFISDISNSTDLEAVKD